MRVPFTVLCGLVSVGVIAGCATPGGPPQTTVVVMPERLERARGPERADPDRPAELAEAALQLLDPHRSGGADPVGAARLCLLAAEAADARAERDLRMACYRLAARSALRAGDRATYVEAVDLWDRAASRHERAAGELRIHQAIRARIGDATLEASPPEPAELTVLLGEGSESGRSGRASATRRAP